MPTSITVAKVSDFPPGSWRVVDVDDTSVLVFNVDGKFYAIENMCTHDGGDLADGSLEGDEIICPRHGARFCVRTGAVTRPPAYEDVATFPVTIEDGVVKVGGA